ncbi:hypothetical protein [Mucilaginibacter sp. HD30]
MKSLKFFILIALFLKITAAQSQTHIISTDIDNFWQAYDGIITSADTAQQYRILDKLFLSKATPGLKAIMEVRDYTAKSYIDAIKNYPLFWKSIRANTLKAKSFSTQIDQGITRFKKLYPKIKPATIYFTMGALRTNGTTQNNQILIGSELALADSNINSTEFPATLSHLIPFFKSNPIQHVVFGSVHEYVHTQQKTTVANTLLGQCVLEGVAEFLAIKATGRLSPTPALAYGPEHAARIKSLFAQQMFKANTGFWLYSNQTNEFNMRDLGYYVGSAICQSYYNKAKSKTLAVKEMIELDYNDDAALMAFADRSGYFNQSMKLLKKTFEASRPYVTAVEELNNQTTNIDTRINKLTFKFSEPMNTGARGFDFGPLGESNVLRVKRYIGFSADGKSVSIEVDLAPDKHYQLLLTERFENVNGIPIKPFLIEFDTSAVK